MFLRATAAGIGKGWVARSCPIRLKMAGLGWTRALAGVVPAGEWTTGVQVRWGRETGMEVHGCSWMRR